MRHKNKNPRLSPEAIADRESPVREPILWEAGVMRQWESEWSERND